MILIEMDVLSDGCNYGTLQSVISPPCTYILIITIDCLIIL